MHFFPQVLRSYCVPAVLLDTGSLREQNKALPWWTFSFCKGGQRDKDRFRWWSVLWRKSRLRRIGSMELHEIKKAFPIRWHVRKARRKWGRASNVDIWEFLHRGSHSAKARQEHSEWTGGIAPRPAWLEWVSEWVSETELWAGRSESQLRAGLPGFLKRFCLFLWVIWEATGGF